MSRLPPEPDEDNPVRANSSPPLPTPLPRALASDTSSVLSRRSLSKIFSSDVEKGRKPQSLASADKSGSGGRAIDASKTRGVARAVGAQQRRKRAANTGEKHEPTASQYTGGNGVLPGTMTGGHDLPGLVEYGMVEDGDGEVQRPQISDDEGGDGDGQQLPSGPLRALGLPGGNDNAGDSSFSSDVSDPGAHIIKFNSWPADVSSVLIAELVKAVKSRPSFTKKWSCRLKDEVWEVIAASLPGVEGQPRKTAQQCKDFLDHGFRIHADIMALEKRDEFSLVVKAGKAQITSPKGWPSLGRDEDDAVRRLYCYKGKRISNWAGLQEIDGHLKNRRERIEREKREKMEAERAERQRRRAAAKEEAAREEEEIANAAENDSLFDAEGYDMVNDFDDNVRLSDQGDDLLREDVPVLTSDGQQHSSKAQGNQSPGRQASVSNSDSSELSPPPDSPAPSLPENDAQSDDAGAPPPKRPRRSRSPSPSPPPPPPPQPPRPSSTPTPFTTTFMTSQITTLNAQFSRLMQSLETLGTRQDAFMTTQQANHRAFTIRQQRGYRGFMREVNEGNREFWGLQMEVHREMVRGYRETVGLYRRWGGVGRAVRGAGAGGGGDEEGRRGDGEDEEDGGA